MQIELCESKYLQLRQAQIYTRIQINSETEKLYDQKSMLGTLMSASVMRMIHDF